MPTMSATEQRDKLNEDQEESSAASRRAAPKPPSQRVNPNVKTPTVDLVEVEKELVQSIGTMGLLALPFLPHTALTLMSRAGGRTSMQAVLDPDTGKMSMTTVERAGYAGAIMAYAKKDPRILRAVIRFNMLMTSGDSVELVLMLASAVAVDVHAIDPQFTIPLPNGMGFQPVMGLIPDIVEEVAKQQQAQADAAEAEAQEGAA